MDAAVAHDKLVSNAPSVGFDRSANSASAMAAARASMLDALWRRRRIFGLVFATILALTALALLVLPVRYRATGSVILAEQEPTESNSSPAWAQKVGDPADMESQLLVMGSPRLLRIALASQGMRDAVVQDCTGASRGFGLSTLLGSASSSCDKLKVGDDAMMEYLRTRYTIGNVGRSRVINVSYDSTQPEVAQKLANALVNAFLEDQRATLGVSRQQAAAGLWDEVRRLDAELRDDDTKIQEYRRGKGLERGSLASVSSERLTAMIQQLSAAEAARTEAEARLKEIMASREGGSFDSPAALGSRTVADLKQQLTTIVVQLAAARSTLLPNHPTLRELERQRAMVEGRITAEVGALLVGAKKRYESTNALVASLKRQVEKAKAEAGEAMVDEGSIESLVRGSEIKRRKYSELYNRASELETERRVAQGNSRLVSLAELPDQPFFPKRVPFLAAGFTLACLFGAAAALLRDRADKTLHRAADLAALADGEICVELARQREQSPEKKVGWIARREPKASLRRALQLAKRDDAAQTALFELYSVLFPPNARPFQTIAVTSPRSGDGKTFVALALARFVAEMGRRALVVECEPAKGALAELFGFEAEPGVLATLSGAVQPREAIVKTPIPRLYVLAAETKDGAERRRLGKGIARLLDFAGAFDLVLLDCPPADSLETRLLIQETDGVLFCARAGGAIAQEIQNALHGLKAGGGEICGLALTLVEADDTPFRKRLDALKA